MSIYEEPYFLVYCCVLAGIIGAVFGSFLNCAAWRIAHGENFMKGRSHCPACGHVLTIPDLFPVVSWLVLGGKCRYCKAKISVRYPLTELFFAGMTVLCLLRSDLSWEFLRNFLFGCCLFCLSLVDLEEMIIPDGTLFAAAVIYAVFVPLTGISLQEAGLHLLAGLILGGAMLALSLLFDRLLKRESMGGGDIKLFAVCGLYLGFAGSLFLLILSCVFGLLFAGIRKRICPEGTKEFPFGPSIAASAWILLLYGGPVIGWYLGLIGLAAA